jgi:hypothetical protein
MKIEPNAQPAEILIPRIMALLECSDAVPLVITGDSMMPFLAHGRDTVFLCKPQQALRVGDMIFYRRDNGRYILHRIVGIDDDRLRLLGDAQQIIEPGIRQDQVIAVVTAVRRKDKILKPGDFLWDFFEKVWIKLIPLRYYLLRIYLLIHR